MLKKARLRCPGLANCCTLALGELLLICFVIIPPGAGLIAPSSLSSPAISPSPSLSSSYVATSTSSYPVLPTISPLPAHHTCTSGPDFIETSDKLATTDRIYLDLSEPVNCTGVITSWYFCHIVIGYRDIPSGLSPCVWRRSNDSNGYNKIGCNKIQFVPGEGEDVRCRQYFPKYPSNFIRVEEGDYIGFYVPDAGLFLALSSSNYDEGNYQLERNVTGDSDFIGDWELKNASSTPGRALLSAEIGQLVCESSIALT